MPKKHITETKTAEGGINPSFPTSIEPKNNIPVLIVDDQAANLFALQKQLASLENISVTEAQSAFDALELIVNNTYALILLDVQMPGMDGFTLADF